MMEKLNLDLEEIKRLYEKGSPSEKIAKEFNCTYQTIINRLRKMNVKIKKSGEGLKLDLDLKKIKKLYSEDNLSTIKIGEIVGVSYKTILKKLKEMNIEIRGRKFKKGTKEFNEENNKILELFNKGLSTIKISKKLNCSQTTIGRRLNYLKVPREGKRDKLKLNDSKIKKLYTQENSSLFKIAKIMDCSPDTISMRLKRMGVEIDDRNKVKNLNKDKIKIIKLYENGKSTQEIAKIFGCVDSSIFNILKKNGIKLRERKEASKLMWKKEGHRDNISKKALKRFKEDTEFLKRYKKGVNRKPNKPETILKDLIKKNDLPFNYVGNGKVWLNGFNPDFLSKNPKHIIELYGDYWHNLPKEKAKHKRRMSAYNSIGYKPLVIWEHELNNLNKVLNKIKKFIR